MNELLELFRYNAWASRIMFDAAAQLPEEQYHRDMKSSHGGIHGTLAHTVWAEHLWLNRWLVRPNRRSRLRRRRSADRDRSLSLDSRGVWPRRTSSPGRPRTADPPDHGAHRSVAALARPAAPVSRPG